MKELKSLDFDAILNAEKNTVKDLKEAKMKVLKATHFLHMIDNGHADSTAMPKALDLLLQAYDTIDDIQKQLCRQDKVSK